MSLRRALRNIRRAKREGGLYRDNQELERRPAMRVDEWGGLEPGKPIGGARYFDVDMGAVMRAKDKP